MNKERKNKGSQTERHTDRQIERHKDRLTD